MAQRVTLRTRKSYNTKSARRKIVKTPGTSALVRAALTSQAASWSTRSRRSPRASLSAATAALRCLVCVDGSARSRLTAQVIALRPRQYATVSKRQKTVQRAYGGSRCGGCVKDRCVGASRQCGSDAVAELSAPSSSRRASRSSGSWRRRRRRRSDRASLVWRSAGAVLAR